MDVWSTIHHKWIKSFVLWDTEKDRKNLQKIKLLKTHNRRMISTSRLKRTEANHSALTEPKMKMKTRKTSPKRNRNFEDQCYLSAQMIKLV